MTREEFLKQLPELVKNYKPAPDVVSHINNLSLLMIVGPSGSGKNSIIEELEKDGLAKLVPIDTTRSPRPGEQEGKDFFFRTDYVQLLDDVKNGRLVQFVIGVVGDLYGTKASSYPEKGIAAMPVLAEVLPQFRKMGFKETTSAYIVPPDFDEWMRRMNSHPLTDEQRAGRLSEAARSLEFALNDKEMHFILNDYLDKAAEQTKNIFRGKIDDERERQAKEVAKSLLESVGYNKNLSQ
jgi:guanylate kinase